MNDIAFSVIINNDGIDDIIFKTIMLKGEKGDKGDAGGAQIDDSTTSLTKTWSSNKINSEISAMPDNLSELDDVNLSNLSDEQLLGYNFNTGKWKNKTINASTLKYDNNTTIKSKIDAKANSADLATVATSGSYNDLSNKPVTPTTCTINVGSSMPTGFPIAKLDRYGKICIFSFDSQLPAKNYSTSDVLWTVTPAPKRATRGLFTLGSASNIVIVTAYNSGEVRFNSSQNLSSATYLIGELAYYTDD